MGILLIRCRLYHVSMSDNAFHTAGRKFCQFSCIIYCPFALCHVHPPSWLCFHQWSCFYSRIRGQWAYLSSLHSLGSHGCSDMSLTMCCNFPFVLHLLALGFLSFQETSTTTLAVAKHTHSPDSIASGLLNDSQCTFCITKKLSCANFTGPADFCQCCIVKNANESGLLAFVSVIVARQCSRLSCWPSLRLRPLSCHRCFPCTQHSSSMASLPTYPWQHMGWTAYQCCCGFQSNSLAEKVGKVAHSSRGRSQVHCVGQQDVPPHGQKCNCASWWPSNYASNTVSLPWLAGNRLGCAVCGAEKPILCPRWGPLQVVIFDRGGHQIWTIIWINLGHTCMHWCQKLQQLATRSHQGGCWKLLCTLSHSM